MLLFLYEKSLNTTCISYYIQTQKSILCYTSDGAIGKMVSKKSSSMEKQAIKENAGRLVFIVEFYIS